MLTEADNAYLAHVAPGTPMGALWRRFWLPALLPSELPDPDCPPVRVRLLGEDLVAWRQTDGTVGVMQNACPHRGASMFFGRNEENGLRCVYHGWKFDTEGQCVDMPNEPAESNFKHKIRATAYPARDWGGLIWIYMGPSTSAHGEALEPPELPQLELCLVPDDHRHIAKAIINNNYAQAMEGDIDSSHVGFLHRSFDPNNALARQRGRDYLVEDTRPYLTFKETDYGFVYGARRNTEDNRYYWRLTQCMFPAYSIIPSPSFPTFGHLYVPIDDHHTWVFACRFDPEKPMTQAQIDAANESVLPGTFTPTLNASNDYGLDRAAQKTKSYTGIPGGNFNAQDRGIVETMGPILDRTREHLGTSDLAVITYRRLMMRMARQLEQGVEPHAPHDGAAYRIRQLDVIDTEGEFGQLLQAHNLEMVVPTPA